MFFVFVVLAVVSVPVGPLARVLSAFTSSPFPASSLFFFVISLIIGSQCGHCKKLAPDYEKLATDLKKAGSPAVIAKIDATEHSGPSNTYGVRGYPTLIFFKCAL